jgi:hypothetical protein
MFYHLYRGEMKPGTNVDLRYSIARLIFLRRGHPPPALSLSSPTPTEAWDGLVQMFYHLYRGEMKTGTNVDLHYSIARLIFLRRGHPPPALSLSSPTTHAPTIHWLCYLRISNLLASSLSMRSRGGGWAGRRAEARPTSAGLEAAGVRGVILTFIFPCFVSHARFYVFS